MRRAASAERSHYGLFDGGLRARRPDQHRRGGARHHPRREHGISRGSTAGLAYTLSPLQARVFGAQMRAAANAAEGHPGMPSDEEVNAAAKVFCGGVWNGFDPATMMPTERFDRFWGDGEGHQLYLAIARHALIAARMSILAGQAES